MNHLSLIEEQSLQILKQIEYYFDTKISKTIKNNSKKNKCYELTFGDLDLKVLKEPTDLYLVANFLQERDLNFEVAFDLVNDNPAQQVSDKYPSEDLIVAGIIKDKNYKIIKKKIFDIKNEIIGAEKDFKNPNFRIILDTKNNNIVIGSDEVPFGVETLEWTILTHLVRKQPSEVSYDEIIENHEQDSNYDFQKRDIKRVGDSRARINSKVQKNTVFKRELIKRRKNNYRFSKKVTKK